MTIIEIVRDDDAPAGWRDLIGDGVDNHNIVATGVAEWHPVNFFLRSADGQCLGGLLGTIWGGWLEIRTLWVDESVRGQGHATALIARAEAFAIERGCTAALLDTHNPAARRLYERLGYALFASLEDYPPGWSKAFLRKQLA